MGGQASGPSLRVMVCVSLVCGRAQVTTVWCLEVLVCHPCWFCRLSSPFLLAYYSRPCRSRAWHAFTTIDAQLVAWADVVFLCCLLSHVLSVCSVIRPDIQNPCVVYNLVTAVPLLRYNRPLYFKAQMCCYHLGPHGTQLLLPLMILL